MHAQLCCDCNNELQLSLSVNRRNCEQHDTHLEVALIIAVPLYASQAPCACLQQRSHSQQALHQVLNTLQYMQFIIVAHTNLQ
jgi:hypothetical protein